MFDCGSSAYLDVGERSIVPALRRLGVGRIDTLLISHADLDHFSGSLDVAANIPVGRVLVTPQMLGLAKRQPGSPAAYLLDHLRRRGAAIHTVSRGWHESRGDADLDLLWPPADFAPKRINDTSAVLSIRVHGRRILLNGDIQQAAMEGLFAAHTPLSADVTDLPHHGSFVDASPAWLARVDPEVVLQSAGHARLRRDKWADTLRGRTQLHRYVTARDGMVELRIDAAGEVTAHSFR